MMNNRKVINDLNKKVEHLENRNGILKLANRDLLKDMEKKENKIIKLLDNIDDLELDKNCLQEQNVQLKNKIIELDTKLCRAKGQLDKLDNYIKLTTGTSILENK